MSTTTTPYMLLFHDCSHERYHKLSPEQMQQFLARWNAWYDGLAESGKLDHGRPLEPGGRVISGPGGQRVVDGPFAETKEAIGGYFLVMVEDLDEATAIAKQCPGLDHGTIVEVRQVADRCRLEKSATPEASKELATTCV